MIFQYTDEKIYNEVDGKIIAEVDFPHRDEKRVNLSHIYVDESLRGQGIASNMMVMAYDYIKSKGWLIVAKCPYAIEWFKKHPDYQDIVINVKTKANL